MPFVRVAFAAVFFASCVVAAEPSRVVLDSLTARCIGPANMGGRVVDLAVVESNPDIYYLATAGGGIWKTSNGGATLQPLFDAQPTMSTGAVAVCQGKPDVVYVGSGEGNPRNSVSPGKGVFKSTDGGRTWQHCGLEKTQHIGRVVVHPTNADIAYVAAMGHFWAANPERGLYKTMDGGQTWTLAKFIDDDTGFIDVQMDPADPETLYACAWAQRRDAFSGGNPKSMTSQTGGIFKTTDGGKTWEKLGGGLPENAYGRCGISIYRKDPKVVFAVVQTEKTTTTVTGQVATPRDKDGKPGKVGAVETGGVFRSDDKGKTWKKLNDLCPRPFYYGQIRVDPTDDQRLFVLGVAFYTSTDGGVTFAFTRFPQSRPVHADNHALWINPKNPDHCILGNDGGLYESTDRGKSFVANRGLVISQFYGVAVDSRTPYRVYGGLQDNGSWGGPVATPFADGVTLADWRRIGGGDGFRCAVDPTDPNIVYAESQYGALSRVSLGGPKTGAKSIRPPAPKGGPLNRWNWNAPLVLSPLDSKTLFYGGNFVFKSKNRGDAWEKISPDLTRAPKDERVTNNGHTLTALAQSPLDADLLWAGTDDGNLWITLDAGQEWRDLTRIVPGVSVDRTISCIEPSTFDARTAFLAIDRHRNDDLKPYIFKTTDAGTTWTKLTSGIPDGASVYCVRQSSKNKDLLVAGTELGLFISIDGGKNWSHANGTSLPATVRIDDLQIHPRERELVVGSHGRGIWIMDIAPLEQLTPEVLKADAHLFDIKPVMLMKEKQRETAPPHGFTAPNPPGGIVVTYLLGSTDVPPLLELRDDTGKLLGFAGRSGKLTPGLKTATLEVEKPGDYTVTLKLGDKTIATKKVTVKGE